MHGYQLNQLLKSPTNPIRIGKANAYKLLAKLETLGFVSHVEERDGNRPPRLVYSITASGKEEFERLLHEQLAVFQPIEYANGIALNLIQLMSPQKALNSLQERQKRLAVHWKALSGFSDEIRASHPGLDFLIRQTVLEQGLLAETIEKLNQKTKKGNHE